MARKTKTDLMEEVIVEEEERDPNAEDSTVIFVDQTMSEVGSLTVENITKLIYRCRICERLIIYPLTVRWEQDGLHMQDNPFEDDERKTKTHLCRTSSEATPGKTRWGICDLLGFQSSEIE